MLSYCLLASTVSYEKSNVSLTEELLYVMSHFSLAVSKTFSLPLATDCLIIKSCEQLFDILSCVESAEFLGYLSYYFFKYYLWTISLSSTSWNPVCIYAHICDSCPQVSLSSVYLSSFTFLSVLQTGCSQMTSLQVCWILLLFHSVIECLSLNFHFSIIFFNSIIFTLFFL